MKTMKIEKQFTIQDMNDTPKESSFWLNKSPQERIAAVEMMRRINYGKNYSAERLSRFFEIAELSQD
ncbi:MAG: hypothetical protein U5R06_19110 [candidate division KSB1 bacterium]|nr:hypothetical protein [candidate division KSB1 bacterium]